MDAITPEIVDVEYNPILLNFCQPLTWERAEGIADTLQRMTVAIAWWWGDLLRMAEIEFGERYTQLIPEDWEEKTGKSLRTLQNWKWVSAAIEPSRRRKELSFSLHEVVAAKDPDEQDRLLALAEKEKWTVDKMSEAAGRKRKAREPRQVTCPECGAMFQP